MTKILQHPFKMGVMSLIEKHFAPAIARRFLLEFEIDLMAVDASAALQRQKKDNNLVLEVRYRQPDGTTEYICDVSSWWSRRQTEAHLLRYITDKVKAMRIGLDWGLDGDKIGVSREITSGKYETNDESAN